MKASLKSSVKKILIVCSLLMIILILAMRSGFNFFSIGGHEATDGDVFRTIGILMTKGYVPYRDIFDHKGPVLYFIEYIATFIADIRGIWPIEVMFLGGSVCVSYIFARRYNNRLISIFVILLMFSRWYVCGFGNNCEEFSLLFQLVSIYYFVDFFQSPESWLYSEESWPGTISDRENEHYHFKLFDLRVFVVGICFACTFFIKANYCAVWIVFCIAIFIHCVRSKYWISLRRFIVSFLVGSFIVTIPVLCYLISNGAFSDFINDYFIFNSLYASNILRVNIKTIFNSIVTFTNTFVCILAFVIMGFKISKKEETFELDVVYTIFMVISVLMITMSGQTYLKMEIAFIPFLIYPFSSLVNLINNSESKSGALTMVVIGYLIISIIYPSWSTQISDAAVDVNNFLNEPEKRGMETDEVVNYIKDNTSEDDKISVFGNYCAYYLYTGRDPASKYIFLPDPVVDYSITEEYFEELKDTLPKAIILYNDYSGVNQWVMDEMNDFLEEYGYILGFDGGDYPVYIRNEVE